jgi:hypothetical protein
MNLLTHLPCLLVGVAHALAPGLSRGRALGAASAQKGGAQGRCSAQWQGEGCAQKHFTRVTERFGLLQLNFLRQTTDEDGTRHSCMYEVVDNTRHFTSAHWKRVVGN